MAMQPNARANAAPTTWSIDPAESRAEFTIRMRMLVAPLTLHGRFSDVTGRITLDEQQPANSRVEARIGAASVATGNSRRDRHLRTADFFDVERFPALQFSSERVETLDLESGQGRISGKLSIRGVTRDVTLAMSFPPALAAGESTRLRITATTDLNRREVGIVWKPPVPVMGYADVARINLTIVAVRTPDSANAAAAPAAQ